MFRNNYTDSSIIKDILAGGNERDQALKYLLLMSGYFQKVKKVIEEGGGPDKKAENIYETCLVQFDKKVRRFEWAENITIELFLINEAKRIWCNELMYDDELRKKAMEWLNDDKKLKKQIFYSVTNNSGKQVDAEDCYQNGMVYLDTNIKEGKYQGGALKGYFYHICFNLWRNELKKSKAQLIEDYQAHDPVTNTDPLIELERKERALLLNRLFEELGEQCRKIINLKYLIIDQYSMGDIAGQMGFKNAQIASNALNKCRKRLWDLLQEHKQAAL